MTFSLRHLLVCILLPMAGAAASAQDFKVGIVNLDRIFREANTSKAAQAKLEQEFSKREKEIADLGAQIERANRVVRSLAEAEKYDLILQEAVYVNAKHDITDKVIKALNAGNVR